MLRSTRSGLRRALLLGIGMTLGVPVGIAGVASPADAVLYVANGAAGDCSQADPCGSIDAAFGRASSGMEIEVAAGTYGKQTITSNATAAASFQQNVVVRPAALAKVTVAGVEVYVPHLTVLGFESSGTLYLRPPADYSRFEAMTTNGAGAYITGADNTAIVGSRIRPSDNYDGIQIKGLQGDNPNNVLLEGNIVGPGRRTDGISHVDCVQFLGGDNAVVRNNVLFDCASAVVHVGDGAGGTVGRILFERNFMRECTPQVETCPGHHAMIIDSANAGAVKLIHNSFAGSVIVSTTKVPDANFDTFTAIGNIAHHLPCTPAVNYNLVESEPCGTEDITGRPRYLDDSAPLPDLRLLPGSPGIDIGSPLPPEADIEGEALCPPADLGADEHCLGPSRGALRLAESGSNAGVSLMTVTNVRPSSSEGRLFLLWMFTAVAGRATVVAMLLPRCASGVRSSPVR